MNGFKTETRERFKFLDERTASEPNIYEVLNEILAYQAQSLPECEKPLATKETIKKSRKIKIPFTTTRNKTIDYLIELLTRRYSNIVRSVISFDFIVNESTKKIDIIETTEYTVLLSNEDFDKLQLIRDKSSLANLTSLLQKYRFFNLSKLIKNTNEKSELNRILKIELGKTIFTFKNFNIDNNKIEWAEDFCFHIDNYESVKESLNLNRLKDMISFYSESIKRGLNKFGMLNADFSDYRDTKLAYIFNILLEDIPATLSEKDLVEAKNLNSLVTCLNKVDKVIDPALIISNDITKYIKENKICNDSELVGAIMDLSNEILKKWSTKENMIAHKIVLYNSPVGQVYYIHGTHFFKMLSEQNQLILLQPEKLDLMTNTDKRKAIERMDILCGSAIDLLSSDIKLENFLGIDTDKINTIKKIVEEYGKYREKQTSQETYPSGGFPSRRKKSLFKRILELIASIFSLFRRTNKVIIPVHGKKVHVESLSHETKQVYKKAANMNAALVPLSAFIELNPENNKLIDSVIQELRDNKLKTVIPIYNARKTLYPKKSQNLLMSDMEYLLVDPEIHRSPESISSFIDSLVGFKLKNEIVPATALIAIEKYLMALYRQKKSMGRKK